MNRKTAVNIWGTAPPFLCIPPLLKRTVGPASVPEAGSAASSLFVSLPSCIAFTGSVGTGPLAVLEAGLARGA